MNSIRPTQAYIDESRAASLLEKWAPVLDYSLKSVAPIEDSHTRLNTAMLLENQEQWCLTEDNVAGGGSGTSLGANASFGAGNATGTPGTDAYAAGDARLPKILIPMIRRTFPELITNEIVGVQPMAGPVGLAFALRYRYSGETLGSGVDGKSGAGYNNQPTGFGNLAGAADKEAGYNELLTGYTGTSAGYLSGLEDGSSTLAGNTPVSALGVTSPIGANDAGVAALLKNFEVTGNIPSFEVSFEKTAVEAGTRRLGARWSVELEQDLKNMNGIDIDTELTNAMSYEIQAEIDREMLVRMIQVTLDSGQGVGFSVWSPASADGRWLVERNRDFYQRLIIEANRIAVRNRRGAANFIVATPRVCAILEMLPEFQWVPVAGNVNTQPVGVAKVGNLGGRFNVYRDTRTEGNSINSGVESTKPEYALLGYKGPEFYDTGIIYCPYIPVMVQRTIGPNDFAPRVGLLTRYGVVDNIFGANLYYHTILCTGLGQQFTVGGDTRYF